MAPTALMTFFFECPVRARTVELLGSWDNFVKPYPMKKDRKRGPLFWSGCYSFQDIICDGDFGDLGQKRDGALKMGGTYWYYFRVDDDEEYHDPGQPSTTLCPLLPGQRLNVLDMPIQSRSRSSSCSSMLFDCFTLNPEDRFTNPTPPRPLTPRQHKSSRGTERTSMRLKLSPIMFTGKVFFYPRSAGCISRSRKDTRCRSDERMTKSAGHQSCSSAVVQRVPDEDSASKTSLLSICGRSIQLNSSSLDSPSGPNAPSAGAGRHYSASHLKRNPDGHALFPFVHSDVTITQTKRFRDFSPLTSHPIDPSDPAMLLHDEPPRKRTRSLEVHTSPLEALVRNRPVSTPAKLTTLLPPARSADHDFVDACESLQTVNSGAERSLRPPLSALRLDVPSVEPSRPPSRRGQEGDILSCPSSFFNRMLPGLSVGPLFQEPDTHTGAVVPEDLHRDKVPMEPSGEFSLWSADSMSFTAPTSNGNGMYSPTFSSFTSSSDMHGPELSGDHGYSKHHEFANAVVSPERPNSQGYLTFTPDSSTCSPFRSEQLSFEPGYFPFGFDQDTPLERQNAALTDSDGFKGYSLPGDQFASEITLTKRSGSLSAPGEAALIPEPRIGLETDTSLSELTNLMSEFGYLGEAVL